jgi:hypothetical protein
MTKMISPDTSLPRSSSPSMMALGVKETLDEAVIATGVNHIQVKHRRNLGCLAIIALVIF